MNLTRNVLQTVIIIFTIMQSVPANFSEGLFNHKQIPGYNNPGAVITADGIKLSSSMQKLDAYVRPEGVILRSLSEPGGGEFSVIPVSFGRRSGLSRVLDAGTVSSEDMELVKLHRSMLIEQFSANADGIRQDFVIVNKPHGQGPLILSLAVHGASASEGRTDISLTLPSGRTFLYGKLETVDADGKVLPSRMEAVGAESIQITVDDRNAKYPVLIDPTITDEDWAVMNSEGIMGVDGFVYALCYCKGKLYVGGTISFAGKTPVNNIAMWDGENWNALGTGVNQTVYAIACDSAGNVYAGGEFSKAGDVENVYNIAKWNGSGWSRMGNGLYIPNSYSSTIRALACDSAGNVYAGGTFSYAGSNRPVKNIAKWTGSTWDSLGSGLGSTANRVNALSFDKAGTLYAGGAFNGGIACWDGEEWKLPGSGVKPGSVNSLCIDISGNLYVAGGFDTAGTIAAKNIAMWDGKKWLSFETGMVYPYYPYAIACDANGTIYVGGSFTEIGEISARNIAKWNGDSWEPVGTGANKTIYALSCDANGNLYAGGRFFTFDETPVSNVAKWTGDSCVILGKGINGSVYGLALDSSGNFYICGGFTHIAGVNANRVAKWDGNSWSALGNGFDGDISTMAIDISGNIYAGGFFRRAGDVPAANVARWDGEKWNALAAKMISEGCKGCDYVNQLLLRDGDLYMAGNFDTIDDVSIHNIARWDGSKWNSIGKGTGSTVRAITFDKDGNLYAGGYFETAGDDSAHYVARWNGTRWDSLGSGVWGSYINDLQCDKNGNLYAAGYFGSAGGVTTSNIAMWNGTKWSALGGGISSVIFCIAIDDWGNLYAGGEFGSSGGITTKNIARWDGSTWSRLGSGTDKSVGMLLPHGPTLFVGGNFNTAGKKVTPRIASVKIEPPVGIPVSRINGTTNTSFRLVNNTLVFPGIRTQDQIRLYTLSGECIRKAQGKSVLDLAGMAPQLLIVRIIREEKLISAGMVLKR